MSSRSSLEAAENKLVLGRAKHTPRQNRVPRIAVAYKALVAVAHMLGAEPVERQTIVGPPAATG